MLEKELTILFTGKRLALIQAKQVHALIITNGHHQTEPSLVRHIILSARNPSTNTTKYVQQILYHLRNPDSFTWSSAIRSFSQHGQFKVAFSLYVKQHCLGLYPSSFAVSSALKACARSFNKLGGFLIHAQVHKYGFCGCVYVQTALVDLHSKLGDMRNAQKVFDHMVEKNVVSWNSILYGYLKNGNLVEARMVFDEMPKKDVISWNSFISGYASMGNIDEALSFFQKMPERNLASWNAMISGYVDCGDLESAKKFFNEMPDRNNVSWITMISGYSKHGDVVSARELFDQLGNKDLISFNAMIACYTQNSRPREAIQLFNWMIKTYETFQPDKMTLVSVVSACSQLSDMRFGLCIESYMNKLGIKVDDHLATALIDLYAKCGGIDKAYDLFCNLQNKDLVAYSAMILGYGINGKAIEARKLFEAMVEDQILPNLAMFTGLLTAFSHAGLVDQGYWCFGSMKDYSLVPSIDHYGIMVDLLGRAGRLEEAYELIKSMPIEPNSGVWGALLLASSLHNNVEFGEIAAQNCFKLEPNATGYRSLLANIYASVGRWDDARKLRKVLEKNKVDINVRLPLGKNTGIRAQLRKAFLPCKTGKRKFYLVLFGFLLERLTLVWFSEADITRFLCSYKHFLLLRLLHLYLSLQNYQSDSHTLPLLLKSPCQSAVTGDAVEVWIVKIFYHGWLRARGGSEFLGWYGVSPQSEVLNVLLDAWKDA